MSGLWLPMRPPNAKAGIAQTSEDIYIYDNSGKKYIDGNSGLWNMPLGYSNDRIKKAIAAQLEKLPFANPEAFTNPAAESLVEALLSILPGSFSHVSLTCTGSEATELAIKLARKYHHLLRQYSRKEIAVFSQSYHGNYYGSMSASGYGDEYHSGYKPLLDGFLKLPLPFTRRRGAEGELEIQSSCSRTKEMLEKNRDSLAAILIEPILGSAGVITLPSELIAWISEFAKDNKILVIFDEISTGFGRTGKMFAFEHFGVVPDIILMAKGLNNGYLPIGAVAASESVSRVFRMRSELLFHLSTQNMNPVCCAAAIETLRQITENGSEMVADVRRKGDYFKERLRDALHGIAQVYDIRGTGLMLAIEFSGKDGVCTLSADLLENILNLLKENGLICTGNCKNGLVSCIYLFPSYIVNALTP